MEAMYGFMSVVAIGWTAWASHEILSLSLRRSREDAKAKQAAHDERIRLHAKWDARPGIAEVMRVDRLERSAEAFERLRERVQKLAAEYDEPACGEILGLLEEA